MSKGLSTPTVRVFLLIYTIPARNYLLISMSRRHLNRSVGACLRHEHNRQANTAFTLGSFTHSGIQSCNLFTHSLVFVCHSSLSLHLDLGTHCILILILCSSKLIWLSSSGIALRQSCDNLALQRCHKSFSFCFCFSFCSCAGAAKCICICIWLSRSIVYGSALNSSYPIQKKPS